MVIDMTYSVTAEGWLYLVAVMDLCSRRIVGWSIKKSLNREIVIQALLMAVWNRKPRDVVVIQIKVRSSEVMTGSGFAETMNWNGV